MKKRLLARLITVAALGLVTATASLAAKDEGKPAFSLSTQRTYAPEEQPLIYVNMRNVQALELRVYRVKDEERFFSQLDNLHHFGAHKTDVFWGEGEEQIDEQSKIEKFHDWKRNLLEEIKDFFRGLFTRAERVQYHAEKQSERLKKSRNVNDTVFAQFPLLNKSRLVERWKYLPADRYSSEPVKLPHNLASGLYLVEATNGDKKAYTIVIVTRMVMVATRNGDRSLLYCVDRTTGVPQAGAHVVLWQWHRRQSQGDTAADGTIELQRHDAAPAEEPQPVSDDFEQSTTSKDLWYLASRGNDIAVMTPWLYDRTQSALDGYVYTDRPIYRPTHTVHIKAIVREHKGNDLVLPAQLPQVHLTVRNYQANKAIYEKDLPVSAHGSVLADFDLPANVALGNYGIQITRVNPGSKPGAADEEDPYGYIANGSFEVEEYKKPEYQVRVTPASQRILQGNNIEATIEARYFFGEPVANTAVKYTVFRAPHWWWGDEEEEDSDEPNPDEAGSNDYLYEGNRQQEFTGKLDADGRLKVSIPTTPNTAARDEDYTIDAAVTDAAGREVTGRYRVLATYGSFRLQAEASSFLYRADQTPRITITAQDYNQKPVKSAVHLQLAERNGKEQNVVAERDTATGANGQVVVDWPVPKAGYYRVIATAKTPEGRTITDYAWLWVVNPNESTYGTDSFGENGKILADKKSYAVGDVAHLTLLTGLRGVHALILCQGKALLSRQVVTAAGESISFDVPIVSAAQPDMIVQAIYVQNGQMYGTHKRLMVPLKERKLSLQILPDKSTYQPGEQAGYTVLAKDWRGNPVSTELSFGAVDEALYSVEPDRSGDIVGNFYQQNYPDYNIANSLEYDFSGSSGDISPELTMLNKVRYVPRLAQVKPGQDMVTPKVRKNFPDTAYWNPTIRTGPDGRAHVSFAFPDSLTTWRATVRAFTDDGRGGSAIARVITRKNVIVRLAAPRFFRQGDEVTVSVIAHNYLPTAKQAKLSLDAAGLDIVGGQAQTITMPSRGETKVDWRVKARAVGNATLTAKAMTNEESDAMQVLLPVEAFGVRVARASAGVVRENEAQQQTTAEFPANAEASTRALTISVSPTVAGSVFDSLRYLSTYPYGCTEQTMSSLLPNLIVADAARRIGLKPPYGPDDLNAKVKAGLERIYSYQHDDGGWGWWHEDESRVFMTAYVVAGLGQARSLNYSVDGNRLKRGRDYLFTILGGHPHMLPALRAYVVYALATSGGNAPADALGELWDRRNDVNDEALAISGLTFEAAGNKQHAYDIAQLLIRRAQNDSSGVYWQGSHDDLLDDWGDLRDETTGQVLRLLAAEMPENPATLKAAQWLAANRNDGDYWTSTKQTAFVLYGLSAFLEKSHELNFNEDVEVLVNGRSVAKRHFGLADMEQPEAEINVPAATLNAKSQVTIRRSGQGRIYWSATSAAYSPDRHLVQQGSLTLNLTRDYFYLEKVQAHPGDPITYNLNPLPTHDVLHVGDIVGVRIHAGGSPWRYMLMEDPIPSGMEWLEHPETYRVNNGPTWWFSGTWWTRQEYHDDRASYFSYDFRGKSDTVYLLKVVNPGRYQVSPAQMYPMYNPAVSATSDAATIEVQP